jgi:hypothetical protein
MKKPSIYTYLIPCLICIGALFYLFSVYQAATIIFFSYFLVQSILVATILGVVQKFEKEE